ncbi:MAG: hypothetical protein HC841_03720 [Verrucomicrobiae bacterium]|nr:hypothetical protein [Verrucomicrobiae bacterium]
MPDLGHSARNVLVLVGPEGDFTPAELGLARARRDELLSVVQLYRALGGGWTEPVPGPQAASASAPQ